MPVNLNAGNAQGMQVASDNDTVGNAAAVKTSKNILSGAGISSIETTGSDMKSCDFAEKPTLAAPRYNVSDLMEERITLSPEMQEMLGIESESVTLIDLMTACIKKLAKETGSEKNLEELQLNLEDMSADDIEMLCLLLCQSSKSKFIDTLKNILDGKTRERQGLNNEYIKKQQEIATEQAKVAQEVAKSKKRAIVKAIFSAIFAVVAAVIAVAVTVVTAGAAGPLMFGLAIAGAVCACGGAACSIASSGLTIAALTTENKDLAEKLNYINRIVGYVGMGFAIAGVLCSAIGILRNLPSIIRKIPSIIRRVKTVVKDAIQAAKTLDKATAGVKTAQGFAQGAQMGVEGGFAIAEGVAGKRLAKLESEMATIKMDMERLDQEIEILSQFIDSMDEVIQLIIKSILETEQKAASEFSHMTENQLSIASKVGV